MRPLNIFRTIFILLAIFVITWSALNDINKKSDGSPIYLADINDNNDLIYIRKHNSNSGQQIAQIWSARGSDQVLWYEDPAYSDFIFSAIKPGNKRMAFVGDKGDLGDNDLMLFETATKEAIRVASGAFTSFLWSESESTLFYILDQNEYGIGTVDVDADKFIIHRYVADSEQDTVIGSYGKLANVKRTISPRFVRLSGETVGVASAGDDQMFEDRIWSIQNNQLAEIVNFHNYNQFHKSQYLGLNRDGLTVYVQYGTNDAGTDGPVGAFNLVTKTMRDLALLGSGWEVKLSPSLAWMALVKAQPQGGSFNYQVTIQDIESDSNALSISGAAGDEVGIWGWLPDESGLIYRLGTDAYWYSIKSNNSRPLTLPDGVILREVIGWQ